MQRMPDRTGVFLAPLCMLIAAVIFSAMLVHSLLRDVRRAQSVIDAMLVALAQTLGGVGVVIVSVALLAPSCVWFARAFLRYRDAVANDRRQMR